MKKHYSIKKALLALLLAIGLSAYAQKVEFLNANNVNAGFGIGGNLFSLLDTSQAHNQADSVHTLWSLLECPKGTNKRTTFTASLWLSALDNGSNLHCAGQRYAQAGHDFYDGPVATNYTSAYDNYYSSVFKVTRSQIIRHLGLGNSIDPSLIDTAILFWPAKGNPFVDTAYGINIASHLAPFIDVDGDQVYNPSHGDVPAICGDEAIFFVFNDDRGPHLETSGTKLGAEIRGLAEVFTDTASNSNSPFTLQKRAINNTVFVSYEIENKSANNYQDLYVGLFDETDLGCFNNDRVGCDTSRNLMFVYNTDSLVEADCFNYSGYGTLFAASGIKSLNNQLTSFSYFTDGAPTAQADPLTCTGYRNYLSGFWNDSTPFTFGGNGYGGSVPTKFMFYGNPLSNSWNDRTSGLPPGDRRVTGGFGPQSFPAGATKKFDYAFIASFDTRSHRFIIIDTLKRDADIIQAFYDSTISACRAAVVLPTASNKLSNDLKLLVYPNPASSVLFVEASDRLTGMELTDMPGQVLITKQLDSKNISLDISHLSKGVYILLLKVGSKTATRKIVIE
ncbi:MAG: hypothetical protein JWO06_1575 [Bacteroidota bacterium]|nr:hypothetical protein [Bacteroidota bacterium]